ncbi:MAG: RNA polymerase sigma factor SigZ [Deltaproteobacteria bacterium]|nr:RNA polymerase sigma factor SigZ [Deltaproteobacteria bacterium]
MIDASSRGAWRDLEAKLRPFIARRVNAEADVDDLVQDVFLRMQRGLGELRDDDRFGPWVYQVARNAVADHHRRAARHAPLEGDGDGLAALEGTAAHDEDDTSVADEVASYLAPFVGMLPSPYREALTLTELEGLTQQEAAERLGISLSGMKSRVQRGRAHLRSALEDCCHIALDARGRVMACEPRPDGRLPPSCCAAPASDAPDDSSARR